MAKKYYCPVCGYETDEPIEICPICKAKMKEREEGGEKVWAAEHILGVAKGVDEEILQGLRENFNGECSEVGMYLAMARVAHREKVTRKSVCTMKRQLTKRPNTQQNLPNCLAKYFHLQQRKTLKQELPQNTAQQRAKWLLPRKQRNWAWTQFTTLCMKWQETKLATAEHLKACLTDILNNFLEVNYGKVCLRCLRLGI